MIPQTALTRHCKGTTNSLNYVVKRLNIKDYLSLFTKMSFCCRFNRKSVVVESVPTVYTHHEFGLLKNKTI